MMTKKIIFSIAIACFILTGCKQNKEVKKETVSLAISGMTCEIGCAKTIQSKLSKKEGVLDAKVIFTDSIANINFDANKTSKKDLIAFIEGVAGGGLYKASETSLKTNHHSSEKEHTCSDSCKEHKKECKEDCEMDCCNKTSEKKHTCADDCKCDKDGKKECEEDCKMDCCTNTSEKK